MHQTVSPENHTASSAPKTHSMKICILASEYFGWGKYGGLGCMSRRLAEALAARGLDAHVIVPRRQTQPPYVFLNGVHVHGFGGMNLPEARRLLLKVNPDLFHSQNPSVLTALAQQVCPRAVHLVTCRDPLDAHDWWIEFRDATWHRRLWTPFNMVTEAGPLVSWAVKRAHGVYAPAWCVQARARRIYGLSQDPGILPNLIQVPDGMPVKNEQPTLTFVGRLDKRKHPERFLELVARFPDVCFQLVGKSDDAQQNQHLRARFENLANLNWIGFVDFFQETEKMRAIFSKTWALVNTASREGLPLTFMEAAAHGCAIVSQVDPDGFATRFGACAHDGDFVPVLEKLLADPDALLAKGRAAQAYIRKVYEQEHAVDVHLAVYEKHLAAGTRATWHGLRK